METREILELVKSGGMSVEEAEGHFRRQPFEDLGFAKLDMHRKMRSGFPEVIFCKGKPDEFLISIYTRMVEADGQAFGTRASKEQYEMVRKVIPDIKYDPVSGILKLEREPHKVGYGANFGGLSALLTMINSCANGIAVVNINNGYGAGYMATQINRLACGGKNE